MNSTYETFAINVAQRLKKEVAAYFDGVVKKAAGKGVSCETILQKRGKPYRLIVDEAIKKKVDMIIMGRRGRRGLEKVLMGRTTTKVIGHAPCNVLLVPRDAQFEFRNILIATDGSEYANDAALTAIDIAKSSGGHIIALSAFISDNEETMQRQTLTVSLKWHKQKE
jgi:nucleotide-binding universal stress UspA family protein